MVALVEKKLAGPEKYSFTPGIKVKIQRRNGINEAAQVWEESTVRNKDFILTE